MEKLDEQAKRRPEFRPGTPVLLADGQSWHLRRPVIWFVPHDEAPAGFRSCIELDPGDDFQELMDERQAAFLARDSGEVGLRDSGASIVGLELRIAGRMLLANYDLAPEEVARVLRFGYDAEANPEGTRIREACMDVAEGDGPKPSPDGDGASPTPSGGWPGATA